MNRKINFLASLCNTDLNGAIKICENYLDIPFNDDKGYLFKDNKAKILAVAHLDTVEDITYYKQVQKNKTPKLITDGNNVQSINLDDRLGVAIILQHLKDFNIIPDILLTTDEETGMSTAQNFLSKKEYNWVFEFDRRGNEVVLYEYQDEYTENLVRSFGYSLEIGSFSDICLLDLGVKGFNFGCGYHYEHTLNCTAKMSTVDKIVKKFAKFYSANKEIKMLHDPVYNYKRYEQYDYKFWTATQSKCDICNISYAFADMYPHYKNNFCTDCCDLFMWDFQKMSDYVSYMEKDYADR